MEYRFSKVIILFIIVLIPPILMIGFFIFPKRDIKINIDRNSSINIKLPFDRWGLNENTKATLNYNKNNHSEIISELKLNYFASPIMAIYNDKTNEVLCLYDHDIKYYLIIFSLNMKSEDVVAKDYSVIYKSNYSIRKPKEKDIQYTNNFINESNFKSIKNISFPTFDVGFFKYYLPKQKLIDLINKVEIE